MSTFVCRCGYHTADLGAFLDHHGTAHDTPIEIATPKRSTLAIGKRRADDPYYAARDAARDPHDPDAFDREILLARRREEERLAALDAADCAAD